MWKQYRRGPGWGEAELVIIELLGGKMKKIILVAIACCLMIPAGCKRDSAQQNPDEAVAKKYAKYRVAVRKEKELKTWLATLEKGEGVDLLGEEKIITPQGKELDVSRVRLADDSVGYVPTGHLADKVIIFTKESKAFIRPTVGTRVQGVIPQGTIGFVIGEKANWVQVYIGKVNGVWITSQWVSEGFVSDPQALVDARSYEGALELLASANEGKRAEGREKLESIARGTSVMAEIAGKKLEELNKTNEQKEQPVQGDQAPAQGDAPGEQQGQ